MYGKDYVKVLKCKYVNVNKVEFAAKIVLNVCSVYPFFRVYPANPASVAHSSTIHFRGPLIQQVSFCTLLSEIWLLWLQSCSLYRLTPFQRSHGQSVGYLSQMLDSSHITISVHQKYPTWHHAFLMSQWLWYTAASDRERSNPSHLFWVWEQIEAVNVPSASSCLLYWMELLVVLPLAPAILSVTLEGTSY